jgi:hypothetical protein
LIASLRFQDRVSPLGAAGALLVALGSFAAIAGLGGWLMAPFIIGTAMLMWDLARIGVVPRLIPIVQGTIAILLTVGFLFPAGSAVVSVFVFGPFMTTWVAIGVSLIHGVPQPRATSE